MIVKHKYTLVRYEVILFDKENNNVILDSGGWKDYMTIDVFYRNYEYCWMPSKS